MDLNGVRLLVAHGRDWSMWPFGPGFTGSWLLTVTKFVFIGVILALIMLGLRLLFGPKGPLRDKDLDREAEEERKQVQESLEILRKRLARGEITEEEFERKERLLHR